MRQQKNHYSDCVVNDQHIASICFEVAQILKEERNKKKISMANLAKDSGLSQPYISYIERGLRIPTLDTLLRIAQALDLDLAKTIAKAIKREGKGT